MITLHEWIAPHIGEGIIQTVLLFTGTCVILLPAIKVLSTVHFIDLYVFGNTKRLKKPLTKETSLQSLKIVKTKSRQNVNI